MVRGLLPRREVVVERLPFGQVMRNQSPRTTTAQDIPNAVQNLPPFPASMESRRDDYLAKVMPVMQRLLTGIAADPDETCTLILSMFGTSVAVMAVPGDAGV